MMKTTLTDIVNILFQGDTKQDAHTYGEVKSINPDGSFQVALSGAEGTTKCAKLMGAKVGDTVMVTIMRNGHAVVTGTVGGDSDAADAQATADGAQATAEGVEQRADDGEFDGSNMWTSSATPTTPNYTFNISDLSGPTDKTPKVGDLIMSSYYRYTITSVSTTTVRAGSRTSIRGADGTNGTNGRDGTDGTDGVSVNSIQTYYYLSTSTQSATGDPYGWQTTPRQFVHGRYFWTKDLVTFSDGTTAWTTPIYNVALTQANETAWNANEVASGIEQHFWTESGSGAEAGVHVTEVPKEEWTDSTHQHYHTGGDVLIKSVGMYIRLAAQVLASFLQDGVRLFSETGSLLASFLATGLDVYDGAGHIIAHLGYGSSISQGSDVDAPYYDLGTRAGAIGAQSLIQGYSCEASESNTTAMGYHCKASGLYSFACGSYAEASNTYAFAANAGKAKKVGAAAFNGSYAEGEDSAAFGSACHAKALRSFACGSNNTVEYNYQMACGKYNNNKQTDLFEVGGGTSTFRRNAFSIDTDGHAQFNDENPFKVFTASGTLSSISPNTGDMVTCTGTVPTGYVPIAVQSIQSNHNNTLLIGKFVLTSNGAEVTIRNVHSSTWSNVTVDVDILCTRMQGSI